MIIEEFAYNVNTNVFSYPALMHDILAKIVDNYIYTKNMTELKNKFVFE
jgi:hypothetical protein